MSTKCAAKTEVYSRVCGFFRPVQQWNKGKKAEFEDRQEYVVEEDRRQFLSGNRPFPQSRRQSAYLIVRRKVLRFRLNT